MTTIRSGAPTLPPVTSTSSASTAAPARTTSSAASTADTFTPAAASSVPAKIQKDQQDAVDLLTKLGGSTADQLKALYQKPILNDGDIEKIQSLLKDLGNNPPDGLDQAGVDTLSKGLNSKIIDKGLIDQIMSMMKQMLQNARVKPH